MVYMCGNSASNSSRFHRQFMRDWLAAYVKDSRPVTHQKPCKCQTHDMESMQRSDIHERVSSYAVPAKGLLCMR
jgi:hypothetical protein